MSALVATGLHVHYGRGISALRDVSVEVPGGACVGVLGANGAGKTTLLRTLAGLLGVHGGVLQAGTVELFGRTVTRAPAHVRVRAGMAQVPEGRRVLADFSVAENLAAGALASPASARRERLDRVHELFPVLRERGRQRASLLSGGEQQMLAIGRALMSGPRLLLMDEPSLGLAPRVIEEIGRALRELIGAGLSVLLVEQNAGLALALASSIVVLDHGEVVHRDRPDVLASTPALQERYLGLVSLDGRRRRLRTEPRRSRR